MGRGHRGDAKVWMEFQRRMLDLHLLCKTLASLFPHSVRESSLTK